MFLDSIEFLPDRDLCSLETYILLPQPKMRSMIVTFVSYDICPMKSIPNSCIFFSLVSLWQPPSINRNFSLLFRRKGLQVFNCFFVYLLFWQFSSC